MEFKQEVLDVLAEVCQEDAVKENPDIEIFEEGLLDSFGTVELRTVMPKRFSMATSSSTVPKESSSPSSKISISGFSFTASS